MAGEPAIDKILTALRQALDDAVTLNGVKVEIDRPGDKAYGNAELPALNIRHAGTAFEMHEQSVQLHRADIMLDMIVETKQASAIGLRLREMEANIIAALWANRTLGGLAQDVSPISTGGDEDVRADEGARSLSIEIQFLTPVGDHRTIIGAAGLVP